MVLELLTHRIQTSEEAYVRSTGYVQFIANLDHSYYFQEQVQSMDMTSVHHKGGQILFINA